MFVILAILFCIGYLIISLEHVIRINKVGPALVLGVLCWTILSFYISPEVFESSLSLHLSSISGILIFLTGALTIVELIDSHDGFRIISNQIRVKNIKSLFWIVVSITFFLSAILDNLTTSIVMISLLRKIISDRENRLWFASSVIIAANAGGAWSPIGDVTTTMLWIANKITTLNIIKETILPSLLCALIPALLISLNLKGSIDIKHEGKSNAIQNTTFFSGLFFLLLVPVLKTLIGLPPYMGILLGLGCYWIIIELLHRKYKEKKELESISNIIRRIDLPSVLFFAGILLAVSALETSELLAHLSEYLKQTLPSDSVIILALGLISAIIDNVPLVAATMGMYPASLYPVDHMIWGLISYCAGTGGSILIFGSAAGVAVMGLENITFGWYLKRISLPALLGYLAGAGVYVFLN